MEGEIDKKGITVSKKADFSEWYTQVVLKAELADYGPVQGTMAIRPTAYEIWEKIQDVFNGMIRGTGHRNAYFPLLIPESLLAKEKEHFQGFTAEVFWVTQSGNNKLDSKLAVRPTSETIMYSFYSKWIRSWRDLPLLLNQWCNTLRAEIKATKPFIRTSEFLWQEGHTVHATKEEADKEVRLTLGFYKELVENYLAIPVISGMKSEREKFAGALYTTTIEAMMPDGYALQSGTSHNLGQNFAKAFEVKFLNKNGENEYAWQTSWGVSTRLIGALIMVHGDDKGLIIPPKVAPTQVIVIPIYKNAEKNVTVETTRNYAAMLIKAGIRADVDERDNRTPGWKFNDHEVKGVPLRIEVGPKEVKEKTALLVRRDTGEKLSVKSSTLVQEVGALLGKIQQNMFDRAKNLRDEQITTVEELEQFKKVLKDKKGFIRAGWCGSVECEDKIKEETGAAIRVIPFDYEAAKTCVLCGKPAKTYAYFGYAY